MVISSDHHLVVVASFKNSLFHFSKILVDNIIASGLFRIETRNFGVALSSFFSPAFCSPARIHPEFQGESADGEMTARDVA